MGQDHALDAEFERQRNQLLDLFRMQMAAGQNTIVAGDRFECRDQLRGRGAIVVEHDDRFLGRRLSHRRMIGVAMGAAP